MFKLENTPQDFEKVPDIKNRRGLPVLGFLITSLIVLCSLYTCSWISVLSPFVFPSIDTRSRIRVNYSPWEVAEVQNLDLSIIQAVEEDRGDGIDLETLTEMDKEGGFWGVPESPLKVQPTPTIEVSPTNTTIPTETATPRITPTLMPTETPNPTQTNTLVSSATPTVFSLTTTPSTLTPTSTPGTVDPLCSLITFGDIEINGGSKEMWFTITNNTGTQITITQIDLTWPYEDNGNLKEIKLRDKQIYEIEIGPSPVTITTWKEGTGIRKIGNGNTQTILFIFDVFAAASGYSIEITFDNGCTISGP